MQLYINPCCIGTRVIHSQRPKIEIENPDFQVAVICLHWFVIF